MQKLMANLNKTTCHVFQDPDRIIFHTVNAANLTILAMIH